MAKPRLLIPMSLQFSVRYLLRTGLLERIGSAAQPVVLLAWEDEALKAELERAGVEVHALPKSKWNGDYERRRTLMNVIFKKQMASPSAEIRERRADLERSPRDILRRKARSAWHNFKISMPGADARIRREEAELYAKETNFNEVAAKIAALKPDAAFSLTPFLYDEEMTLRACAQMGIPMAAAILSFDNLTTRSWIPVLFDEYILWNRHNAEQLVRGYPEAAGRRITLTGTPQFDFYYDNNYLWDEKSWREELRIPEGKRAILFGGGYFTCAPHEPQFLGHLEQAIQSGELPKDLVVLFRKHPVDPIDRWKPILDSARNIVYDEPWKTQSKILGHTNVGRRDIEKLFSTLFHSSVHVNVASTMTIDGAVVDRPQVGPAYDESPTRKYHQSAYECYTQEHYAPILPTGGVAVSRSRREFIDAVKEALESPSARAEGRRKLIHEICTFNDGKCADRVYRVLLSFLGKLGASAEEPAGTVVAGGR